MYRTKEELKKQGFKPGAVPVLRYGEDEYKEDDNVLINWNGDDVVEIVLFDGKGKQYTIGRHRLDSYKGIADLYRSITQKYIKIPAATAKTMYAELDMLLDRIEYYGKA